jgi:hypothetical protein
MGSLKLFSTISSRNAIFVGYIFVTGLGLLFDRVYDLFFQGD